MHKLLDFLKSNTFGFLLKLFSGLAAAGFGIMALGAKTHDGTGKLTRKGRIALTGIVVAGMFAIGTSLYDFVSGQERTRTETQSREQLLLSIRRGIYPFMDARFDLQYQLKDTFPPFAEYKALLRQRFSSTPSCQTKDKDIECVLWDPELFSIPQKSRLYPPARSVLSDILTNLAAIVWMSRLKPAMNSHETTSYIPVGVFFLYWYDALPQNAHFVYDRRTDTLSFVISQISMTDRALGESSPSSTYSLVDFIPGLLSIQSTVASWDRICPHYGITGRTCTDRIANQIARAAVIDSFSVRLPYPKEIDIQSDTAIHCRSAVDYFGDILVIPINESVDERNIFGSYVPMEKRPKEEVAAVCAVFERMTITH